MRLAAKRQDWRVGEWDIPEAEVASVSLRSGLVELACVGRGEPLVLLPGLAGGWRLLVPLARRLARRHRVIMVGMTGDRGYPMALGGESPEACSRELAAVLATMRLERPTIFGVSFGGAVALELALAQPALVGRLVVAGAAARFEAGLAAAFARRILERFPLPTDNPFVNQFFNLLHGKKPEPGPLPRFIVERCWETDQSVMAGRLRALEDFDITDRLWQLDVPTLVIAGTRDVFVDPERQADLARSLKNSRFEPIAEAGHVGFLTHRNEVAAIVGRWLATRAKTCR